MIKKLLEKIRKMDKVDWALVIIFLLPTGFIAAPVLKKLRKKKIGENIMLTATAVINEAVIKVKISEKTERRAVQFVVMSALSEETTTYTSIQQVYRDAFRKIVENGEKPAEKDLIAFLDKKEKELTGGWPTVSFLP